MGNKTGKQINRIQGHETLRDLGDALSYGFGPDAWDATWRQILGADKSSEKGGAKPDFTVTDPVSGEQNIFDIKAHQSQKSAESKHSEKAPVRKEAAIDHHNDFVRSSERASKQEMHEINQRLQDIMAELQRLVSSSKVLQMEFAGVTVDQAPQQAGEYHLNFFDWLLLTIRAARQKVEDSGAWLATTKKKGGKKGGGYWDMFKKHGTSFGLSNERGVATQTG